MSALFKSKEEKKCPRCGQLALTATPTCPACGLNYSKLLNSTNKSAKRCIKAGHPEYVVNVTKFPYDLNKKKFVALLILLGWVGGHNFYIGKYKTAFFQLISVAISIMFFALCYVVDGSAANIIWNIVLPILGLFNAASFIIWLSNISGFIFGSFKFPVAPDDVILKNN